MIIYFISLLLYNFQFCDGLNNGLALTPPMGFLSWKQYGCNTDCENEPMACISEELFQNIADLIVLEGYKDVGYEYIIIDDCWLARTRDSRGRLQADRYRFPHGIKELAKYVHSKGLKLGIYATFGKTTCMGYPGSINHMKSDVESFVKWEVDYIKLDGCFTNPFLFDAGFPEFGKYINKTGRPIVFACSWPVYQKGLQVNYEAVAEHCNLWRSFVDIEDSWPKIRSVMNNYALKQDVWEQYVKPGQWNDPDMLMIGNNGLNYEQSKTQMAIWAIMAAPLLMSTDLNNIKTEMKNILCNKAIIDINQDIFGIAGKRIYQGNIIEIWTRKISPVFQTYHSYAIAIVHRFSKGVQQRFNVTLESMGLLNPLGYTFRNLFDDTDESESFVMTPKSRLHVRVMPSGVVFHRATSNSE